MFSSQAMIYIFLSKAARMRIYARFSLAYPKKTKQVRCSTPIFLTWESPAACHSRSKTTCNATTDF
jgi:hypothetical protein